MAVGYVLIGVACLNEEYIASFYVSLFASVILGVVSALGESTILGFCKGFPSSIVGYFGSGTGFAGVVGSGVVLLTSLVFKVKNIGTLFFIVTPTAIIYFLAFWWVYNKKSKHPYI